MGRLIIILKQKKIRRSLILFVILNVEGIFYLNIFIVLNVYECIKGIKNVVKFCNLSFGDFRFENVDFMWVFFRR